MIDFHLIVFINNRNHVLKASSEIRALEFQGNSATHYCTERVKRRPWPISQK